MLRVLGRRGCSAWVERRASTGRLPGLPAPDSPEALARGLVRVDRQGQADGPGYHPLHPEVREAMTRRVAEAIAPRQARPAWPGVLIRLGPGPTLLGGPDTGLDDADLRPVRPRGLRARTAARRPRPGTRPTPDRFAARRAVPRRARAGCPG